MTRAKVFAALFGLIALAGCNKAGEKAFNDGYEDKYRSSCIASATSSKVPAVLAKSLCDCAIDEINKKYSATEKLTLSQEKVTPILKACLNKTVLK